MTYLQFWMHAQLKWIRAKNENITNHLGPQQVPSFDCFVRVFKPIQRWRVRHGLAGPLKPRRNMENAFQCFHCFDTWPQNRWGLEKMNKFMGRRWQLLFLVGSWLAAPTNVVISAYGSKTVLIKRTFLLMGRGGYVGVGWGGVGWGC